MEKNAARQTADKAGHDGPITTGSPNVTTGGFPAARMGDSFICKEHGPGVISEGSKTVTINGMPAARHGDNVICGKEILPPTKGPIPPEYHYLTLAKNTHEDGSVKVKNTEEFQMNVLLASSQLSDSDGDGNFDTANNKIVLEDFQLSHQMGDSGANLNLGGTIGKAEMIAGTISNEKNSSSSINAKLTGVSGNVGISSGKEGTGDYAGVKAEGTIGTAEGKGEVSTTYDSDELSYGTSFELGAEAAVAKGELSGIMESKYLKVKGSASGSAGSLGAGIGAGVWTDIDNIMLKLKLTGELAFALGLKGDVEVQLGPFTEIPVQELLGLSSSKSGIVRSGAPTIIIGG